MDDFKLVRAVQNMKSITPAVRQPLGLRKQRTHRPSSAGTLSPGTNSRNAAAGCEASPAHVNPSKPTEGALSAVRLSPSRRKGSTDLRNRCGGSPRLDDFASPQPFDSASQRAAAIADAMGASLGSLDRDARGNVESFEEDAKWARSRSAAGATAPIVYGTNPMQLKQLREQNQMLQHAFNDTRSQLVLTLKELRQTAKAKRGLEAEKTSYISKLEAAGKAVRAVLAAARSKEAELHATVAVLREELEECEQLVVAAAKLRQIAPTEPQRPDSKHESGSIETETRLQVASSSSGGAEKGGEEGRAPALAPLSESALEPPRTIVAAMRLIADALRVPFDALPLAEDERTPRRMAGGGMAEGPPSQMRSQPAAARTTEGAVAGAESALCSASGESAAVQAHVQQVVTDIFDRVRTEMLASLSGSLASPSASGIASANSALLAPCDAQPKHPRALSSASDESAVAHTEVEQVMNDVLDRVRSGLLASATGALASRSASGIASANTPPSEII